MMELQRLYEIRKDWEIGEIFYNNGLEIVYVDESKNDKRLYVGASLVGETSFSLIGDSYTGERICKDIAHIDDVKEELNGIITNAIKNNEETVSEKELEEARVEKWTIG